MSRIQTGPCVQGCRASWTLAIQLEAGQAGILWLPPLSAALAQRFPPSPKLRRSPILLMLFNNCGIQLLMPLPLAARSETMTSPVVHTPQTQALLAKDASCYAGDVCNLGATRTCKVQLL